MEQLGYKEHARILLSQPELSVSFLLSRGAGTAPLPSHLLPTAIPQILPWDQRRERREGQPRLPGRAGRGSLHGEVRDRRPKNSMENWSLEE